MVRHDWANGTRNNKFDRETRLVQFAPAPCRSPMKMCKSCSAMNETRNIKFDSETWLVQFAPMQGPHENVPVMSQQQIYHCLMYGMVRHNWGKLLKKANWPNCISPLNLIFLVVFDGETRVEQFAFFRQYLYSLTSAPTVKKMAQEDMAHAKSSHCTKNPRP